MAKQNERTLIFDAVALAREKYLSSRNDRDSIQTKMEEEIKESEKRIRESYQNKFDKANKNIINSDGEYQESVELLEKYSTFDYKIIGDIIAQLISTIEGEKYSYHEAIHDTYIREATVFGSETFPTKNKVFMIVHDKQKQNYYRDYSNNNNEVKSLVNKGQAIVLAEDKYISGKQIKFYTVSYGKITLLINLNKFPYVKEFIDAVIQHRFEQGLDKITKNELLSLMKTFILDKKDLIEENFRKRILESQEQLMLQLEEEQLRHKEEMERLELEALLQNGVPRKHENDLIDRLQDDETSDELNKFEILYEGEKHPASITYSEPFISSENIFISKIDIKSHIKDYFDDSDPDPHFHGECDIDLIDDGLIGIIDISSSKQDLKDIINSYLPKELYKVDKISDKYLRVLYLPNKGEYRHKPINVYNWIVEEITDKNNHHSTEKVTSYKIEWSYSMERTKLFLSLREIELMSNLSEKQLKMYKQRKSKVSN